MFSLGLYEWLFQFTASTRQISIAHKIPLCITKSSASRELCFCMINSVKEIQVSNATNRNINEIMMNHPNLEDFNPSVSAELQRNMGIFSANRMSVTALDTDRHSFLHNCCIFYHSCGWSMVCHSSYQWPQKTTLDMTSAERERNREKVRVYVCELSESMPFTVETLRTGNNVMCQY